MAETGAVGTGTTITFATSTFAGEILSVSGSSNDSVEDIVISHLGTTGYHKKIPTTIQDGGTYSLEVIFTPAIADPTIGVEESIAIDWAGTGKTDTFPGYATSFTRGAPFEDKMMATLELTVAGDVVKVRNV